MGKYLLHLHRECSTIPVFILSAELHVMVNKIRQDLHVKGIEILGNELKLSQYADDTNLFCADLDSVEKALEIVDSFGMLAGLKLNRKKKQKRFGWENGKIVKATLYN